MDSFIAFHQLINQLGLSNHPNQLDRRRVKYPHHFTEIENVVYVSKRYAYFLITYHWAIKESLILQEGGSDVKP